MWNEQLVFNFMELTNLTYEDSRRYIVESGQVLEVAIQNYYDTQQGEELAHAEPSNPPESQYEEDEVRAPLPREFSQLVEDESVRSVQLNRVKRQFSSSFRDLKRETEIQEDLARGIAPKRKCLEDIYRNPIDITFNLDLYSAKLFGQKQGKWIALLINDENFPSLSFNRDIFNSDTRQRVKQLIKKSFIFLRKNSSCEESLKILQNYKLAEQSIPVFLIIDSLTGELKKNFGDTKELTLKSVVHELKKYTSTPDHDLKYSSDGIVDSDDDVYSPVVHFAPSSSHSALQSSTIVSKQSSQKPYKYTADPSDSDDSFASIQSNDVNPSEDEEPVAASEPAAIASVKE